MVDWLRRWAARTPWGRAAGRRPGGIGPLPRWRRLDRRARWTLAGLGGAAVLVLAVLLLRPSPPPEVAMPLPPKAAPAPVVAMVPLSPPPPPMPAPPPSPQTATIVPPPGLEPQARPESNPATEPAWLRYAVPAPPAEGRPRIAIIIDDLGLDRRRTARAIGLQGAVTLSFLAYAEDLPLQTAAAREAGHELLVHVPMQPINRAIDMGPNGLKTSLSPAELERRLRWDLARFKGYVGINNHMGSRFTEDAAGMTTVLKELKARGLLFIDSRTIGNSVGSSVARRLGVPYARRDVFLDDVAKLPAVMARLAETEAVARRHGTAIAIGHPHDATLEALYQWLPTLAKKGIELVPVSAVVKGQRTHAARAAAPPPHPGPLRPRGAEREGPASAGG
jgi:polysaccharide deacetylase 2 family uncharacterized protein YibQ